MGTVGPLGGGGLGAAPLQQAREATSPEELRKMSLSGEHPGIRQRVWGLAARTDPTVTFEEYRFWADIERRWEEEEFREFQAGKKAPDLLKPVKRMFVRGPYDDTLVTEGVDAQDETSRERNLQAVHESTAMGDEKKDGSDVPINADVTAQPSADVGKEATGKADGTVSPSPPPSWSDVDRNAEWRQAARALRTATWGGIFYLVTTDVLGWSGTPYVFASVGYGMGVALFIIFGLAAATSARAIWSVFMGLDSSRYPMLSYGDTFLRTYGPGARHFINVTQSIQQFCSVAVLLLGQSQTLVQLAENKICFVVCMVIIMVTGMASGFLRSLKHISWLSSLAVYVNIVSFIVICISAAHFAPDYDAVTQSTLIKIVGPIKTFAGPPPPEYQQQSTNEFAAQFNGIDQMVYAYSGAVLFVAFLAEMRHPWDFWKGVFAAQAFICFVYIFFGAFVYSFWGQYSSSLINNSVEPFSLQIVGNVLTLITGNLAIFLYFNVGMKTVYLEVFQELLHFPPITEKKGKYLWWGLGPFYWILALVVSASVPNFSGIVSLVGGLLGLNFTYSLPGIMYLGFKIQDGAQLPGEGFDPSTGLTTRHDSGPKRWWRGFCKTWYISIPMLLFSLAALASSGMGSWAAIEGLIAVFAPGGTVATSWGCAAPV